MRHLMFMIMLIVCQNAMGNDYITVFKAGGNVCTPITINSSAGNYTLTRELRIPKSLSWFEAFDCRGRKIMETESSVSVGTGQTTVRTYVLDTLFPTTSNQSESEEPAYDDNGSSHSGPPASSRGNNSDYIQNTADWLSETSRRRGWDIDCNTVTLDVGYGYPYGGLGVRARYISPCVIGISAAVGYNTEYEEHTNNNKKIYWNAGVQFHLNKYVALALYGGPEYFKDFDKTHIGLGAFLEGTYNIYKPIGVTGGLGCVIDGEEKDTKGYFAGHIGLTFRLFSD
ncbi:MULTISPECIES: hypothetical protein [Prevotella]|uniref:hypothetical protein n=1 Tax=Prevotella pectinovora TaxID=1602169 RepID=UPI0027E4F5D0|nr:hypothetical protein [Prevotella sp.]